VIRELGSAGAAPRVPTQLLSAALAFGTALVMLAILGAGGSPGFATGLGSLCYALGRFHLEDLREELRLVSGRLTRGQLLSMVIAGLALAWLAVSPGADAADATAARAGLGFAWAELGQHAGLALVAAIPVFLVCGYHRRSVGRW
jgi:prolipoprotein diacylglyceryltransferase